MPEVGGKIWAAIEKSTGKSYIYYNHTVKFRDVGNAWTMDQRGHRTELWHNRPYP
ncbi:MAG: DUF5107 domain-containing protein [Segetibacter sp.]